MTKTGGDWSHERRRGPSRQRRRQDPPRAGTRAPRLHTTRNRYLRFHGAWVMGESRARDDCQIMSDTQIV
eukprot:5046371-Prymnesium_polylepis.1